MKKLFTITLLLLTMSHTIIGLAETTVVMHMTSPNGTGKMIGTIIAKDTPYGLILMPNLQGLPPGLHGFHVHQYPNCGNGGMNAGGHFDPKKTGKHLGPYNDKGHLGDLPALFVDAHGKATHPILAPRMEEAKLMGRSLIIHAGGDNYSDVPEKLGGGGARIACGTILNDE